QNDTAKLEKRGTAYLNLGQYENALQDFNELLLVKPNDAVFLSKRGYVSIMLTQYSNAFNDLDKALDLEPNTVKLYQNKNALNSLNKALEIQPSNTTVLKVRVQVYYIQGQHDNALTD